jgi:hypothetical protein
MKLDHEIWNGFFLFVFGKEKTEVYSPGHKECYFIRRFYVLG